MACDSNSTVSCPTTFEQPAVDLLNIPLLNKRKGSGVSFVTAPPTINVGTGMRRRSTLKSCTQGVMGMLRIRRLTMAKIKQEEPKIKYENTYRLEPKQPDKFSPAKVQKTAENVLSNYLENMPYNERTCGQLACNIADIIKNRIKDMNIPRYRIICQVIIGEEKSQGLEAASMSVWNDKTDNYACASFKNNSLFALAMIHGVYLE